jgi:alkaline phosphatase
MVEGGRIDHAHHAGNAYRALTETIELSNAVRAASQKVNLDETLIIVTADHSHTFNMLGYPARGNNILGLVREIGLDGSIEPNYKLDAFGMPYTTLNYTNGRGNTGTTSTQPEGSKICCAPLRFTKPSNGRPDLRKVDTTAPDYLQEALIPLSDETHGGEDVAIFATGVNAYIIRGSMEENWIFYVMADAFRLKK